MRQNKRVYIASKVNRMERIVTELRQNLEDLGFTIIYDWTENFVPKPFEKHIAEASAAAEAMAKAVMNCDILIVLYVDDGLGLHIETGGALVASIIQSFIAGQEQKQVFVVGPGNDRSVFYFHKSVQRLPDITTLVEKLRDIS